jgi:hypothetical protein
MSVDPDNASDWMVGDQCMSLFDFSQAKDIIADLHVKLT